MRGFKIVSLGVAGLVILAVSLLYAYRHASQGLDPVHLSGDIEFKGGGGSLIELLAGHADYVVQACCETSLARGSIPDGRSANWFVIDRSEPLIEGAHRAELRFASQAMGRSAVYEAEVFVPADWPINDQPVLVMQWHGARDRHLLEGGRVPPLEIAIEGSEWVVRQASDSRLISTRDADAPVLREIARAPVSFGQVAQWHVDVTWDWRQEGALSVVLDDQLLAEQTGANAFNDLIGPYWKFGIYSPKWKHMPDVVGPSSLSVAFLSAEISFGSQ